MSIYGNSLENYNNYYLGESVIAKNFKNVDVVRCFTEDGGLTYIQFSDLERYMEANCMIDVEEAVNNIKIYNNISDVVFVENSDNEYVSESLKELGYVVEASVEDNATNLNKACKWYLKVVNASKKKAESVQEIKDRIKVLKECVKQMEAQQKDVLKDAGIVKYVLKNMIPFNSIYRLIKRQDCYAGIGIIANIAWNIVTGGAGSVIAPSYIIRAVTYKKMLQRNIDSTNEAIKYLEDKLKEFK